MGTLWPFVFPGTFGLFLFLFLPFFLPFFLFSIDGDFFLCLSPSLLLQEYTQFSALTFIVFAAGVALSISGLGMLMVSTGDHAKERDTETRRGTKNTTHQQ